MPSASVALTIPIEVWFSSTVNKLLEVNTGALSLRLVISIVIFCVVLKLVSLAWTVMEYDCLFS